jgi:hypothetical protein
MPFGRMTAHTWADALEQMHSNIGKDCPPWWGADRERTTASVKRLVFSSSTPDQSPHTQILRTGTTTDYWTGKFNSKRKDCAWSRGGGMRRGRRIKRKKMRKKKTGHVISIYSDLHLNTNHIVRYQYVQIYSYALQHIRQDSWEVEQLQQ